MRVGKQLFKLINKEQQADGPGFAFSGFLQRLFDAKFIGDPGILEQPLGEIIKRLIITAQFGESRVAHQKPCQAAKQTISGHLSGTKHCLAPTSNALIDLVTGQGRKHSGTGQRRFPTAAGPGNKNKGTTVSCLFPKSLADFKDLVLSAKEYVGMFVVKGFQTAKRRSFLLDIPNRPIFNVARQMVEQLLKVDTESLGEGGGDIKRVVGTDVGAALGIMELLVNELLHDFFLLDEAFFFVSRFPSQTFVKTRLVGTEVDENAGTHFVSVVLPGFFLGLRPGAKNEVELPFRAGAVLGAVFSSNQLTQRCSQT